MSEGRRNMSDVIFKQQGTQRDATKVIPRGIISADGHVCEPPNCYVDYIDPKYRDSAPRIVPPRSGAGSALVTAVTGALAELVGDCLAV